MIQTCFRLSIALCAGACLCACATYPMDDGADPVPLGNGVYLIDMDPGYGENAGMHSPNYQRAIRFCFEQGKQLSRLDGQTGMRDQAAPGVRFRCVGPDEPGWKEPVG